MGMSSSQARLLSLTARMHDIEYKAQRIEAQKLQLANESDKAYETYLDALDKKKFMAKILGSDGAVQEIPFTANAVYSYKTLYDQYALKTVDGKALIPDNLHTVYQNTGSLSDYLSALGLSSNYSQTVHHEEPNPAYDAQYQRWSSDLDDYNRRYQQYLETLEQWESESHPAWEAQEPDPADPIYIIPGISSTVGDQYDSFLWASAICYGSAMSAIANSLGEPGKELCDQNGAMIMSYNSSGWTAYTDDCSGTVMLSGGTGSTDCYSHVLDHLIRIGNHTTTTGATLSITSGNHWYPAGTWNNRAERAAELAEIFAPDASEVLYCSAEGLTLKDELLANPSDNKIRLLSNYYLDGSGTPQLKTIYQKIVDLDYAFSSGMISLREAYDQINQFTDNDIRQAFTTEDQFNEEAYNQDVTTWHEQEPPRPQWTESEPKLENYIAGIPQTLGSDEVVQHTTFNDPDLAQWYINLWCKMEGEDDTPKVQVDTVHNDATGEDKVIYSVDSRAKSSTTYGTEKLTGAIENDNYIVIPNDKLSDPDWVYNSISEGYVLIQQYDKLESKFVDTSVSVTSRISEVSDNKDIKKAEADYEAKMRQIDKKDRRYDTQLAACETERDAIKLEIDTLKTVIKDNGERTFKLFS